jgi:hypothetical protein
MASSISNFYRSGECLLQRAALHYAEAAANDRPGPKAEVALLCAKDSKGRIMCVHVVRSERHVIVVLPAEFVFWAHTLEQHHLSLQGHGQPCMIEKLQKLWLKVGYRRAVWLLRENGIKIIGAPKFRVMTDSNHAPSLLKHDFRLMRRTKMPLGDGGVICR